MNLQQPLSALIDALRILPGIGPKTAQRMAFQLLQHQRHGAQRLLEALSLTLSKVGHCTRCNNFSTASICELCESTDRDPRLLCIVETPTDLIMMEQTGAYQGYYFVLMGHLSPLEGIGPQEINFPELVRRIDMGGIEEVILATNLTAEGDATADALAALLRHHPIHLSRLARGLPVGGELEYSDRGTLAQAFRERRQAIN